MLAPRQIRYTSTRKEKETQEQAKDAKKYEPRPSSRTFGWRPLSFRTTTPVAIESSEASKTLKSASQSTSKTSERSWSGSSTSIGQTTDRQSEDRPRSRPVAVPGKRQPRDGNILRDASPKPSTQDRRSSVKHDPTAMPPSVAALLAMTSIPRKNSFPSRKTSTTRTPSRNYSSQSLMEEWKQSDVGETGSLGSSPNLHILLSPPEHARILSRSSSEETLDSSHNGGSPSVDSLPSLSTDDRSITSSFLRSSREVPRKGNRDKAFSLSESLENDLEHPLSFEDGIHDPVDDNINIEPSKRSSPRSQSPINRKPSSFKSNLTASLTAIKSSWRSLSNFASMPYTLPDDHLSRGLFAESQLIHREMRPRPLDRPPSAELRRYLNPSQYHASPHMDFHHHGSVIEHVDYEHLPTTSSAPGIADQGSVIALQDRSVMDHLPPVPSGSSSSDAAMTEAGRAMQNSNQQYRREIRENSAWLRICVLETNMRRAGKIDGPGHAKLWLQAREVTQLDTRLEDVQLGSREAPPRWIPMVCG